MRSADHRQISGAYDAAGVDIGKEYSDGMMQFMADGNVRIHYQPGALLTFDISQKLTEQQKSQLAELMRDVDEVAVDVNLPGGGTWSQIFSTEEGRIHPHDIFRQANGALAMAEQEEMRQNDGRDGARGWVRMAGEGLKRTYSMSGPQMIRCW